MSARNLRYMQKFATEFDNDEFLQHHVAKIPWSSLTTIMDQAKELLKNPYIFDFITADKNLKELDIEKEDYYSHNHLRLTILLILVSI